MFDTFQDQLVKIFHNIESITESNIESIPSGFT